MFTEFEYLPWSGRRYQISVIGEISNSDGEVISPKIRESEQYVEIDWVLGRREYNLATLVLVAYGLIKLPDYLLDKVEPLYRDGISSNLSPVNLLYRFKNAPVEVTEYPGFYYIPFYVDYAISKSGELINIKTGKSKLWSLTPSGGPKNQTGGYLYSRVISDRGFSKTLFQHRALCLVFKNYGHDVDKLVVNHIDGNPGNNSLDNLELVTYLQNNLHAVETGLRGDNKPVLSKNILTGEVRHFFSRSAAARYYKRPVSGYIHNRLTKSFGKVFPDMLLFKFDDGTPWPDIDLDKEKMCMSEGVDVAARNVFTGEVVLLNSCPHAEVLTGVKAATVLHHVKNNSLIPVSGWNFRFVQSDIRWPQHNERLLRIYSKYPIYPPDGVIVHNVEDNSEVFYESVALATKALNIHKRVIYEHNSKQTLLKNKYKITLYRIREHVSSPPTE